MLRRFTATSTANISSGLISKTSFTRSRATGLPGALHKAGYRRARTDAKWSCVRNPIANGINYALPIGFVQSSALATMVLINAQGQPAAVRYWHLWTGHDGTSHLTKCTMKGFVQAGGQQWQAKQSDSATVIVAYNPKGDWHENPKVQWVMPVQGSFFAKAQDGSEVTLPPGALLLGEDLNTRPDAQGTQGSCQRQSGRGAPRAVYRANGGSGDSRRALPA